MTAPPTPAPARCDTCDRPLAAAPHDQRDSSLCYDDLDDDPTCWPRRQGWPARARAAESALEAATERAVKAEALLAVVEKTFDRGLSAPRTPLIESIRQHLRGGK